jgi:hypothetical protein
MGRALPTAYCLPFPPPPHPGRAQLAPTLYYIAIAIGVLTNTINELRSRFFRFSTNTIYELRSTMLFPFLPSSAPNFFNPRAIS